MNPEQRAIAELHRIGYKITFKHYRIDEPGRLCKYSRTRGWEMDGRMHGDPLPQGGTTECRVDQPHHPSYISTSVCSVNQAFSYAQGRRYSLARIMHAMGDFHRTVLPPLCAAIKQADPTIEKLVF